jgi:hypothetical protein
MKSKQPVVGPVSAGWPGPMRNLPMVPGRSRSSSHPIPSDPSCNGHDLITRPERVTRFNSPVPSLELLVQIINLCILRASLVRHFMCLSSPCKLSVCLTANDVCLLQTVLRRSLLNWRLVSISAPIQRVAW